MSRRSEESGFRIVPLSTSRALPCFGARSVLLCSSTFARLQGWAPTLEPVSYTHLRAHETSAHL
eukprot:6260534-Alexandrium_andersonii.AAC.1